MTWGDLEATFEDIPAGLTFRELECLASHMEKPPNQECEAWWMGALNHGGYPTMKSEGKTRLAHTRVYEIHHGPIPEGMVLHHACGFTWCVSPGCLQAMTPKDHQALHASLKEVD